MADLERVAWAAGLFEGEGSIFDVTSKGCVSPHVALAMTDRDVVERFRSVMGFGRITEWDRKGGTYKRVYRWRVTTREEVQAALAMFWRFLGDRRKSRAREALILLRDRPRRDRRHG